MASPQLEDGYTKIANELLDALALIRVPGEARQVFDAVLRKTYGFKKAKDTISLSQLIIATGLKKPTLCRAIKKLEEMRMITIIKKDNGYYTSYSVQKDYSNWKPLSKKITLSKKIMIVDKKDNQGGDIIVTLKRKSSTKENTPLPPKGGGEGSEKSLAMIIVDTYVRFTNEPAITQATRKRYKKHAEELVRLSRNALTEDNEETTDENILCVISKRFKALEQRWPGKWTPSTAVNWFDRILEN